MEIENNFVMQTKCLGRVLKDLKIQLRITVNAKLGLSSLPITLGPKARLIKAYGGNLSHLSYNSDFNHIGNQQYMYDTAI